MLRDFSPSLRRSLDEPFLMNSSFLATRDTEAAYQTSTNDLDDIFGSAPSSPSLNPRDAAGAQELPRIAHPSDIPRLRSTHVTNGYREGIAVSKEKYIQEGFDEGYSLGGEVGLKAGCILGVLEGMCSGMIQTSGDGATGSLQKTLSEAKNELRMEILLGKEYFGAEGIWRYEVFGQKQGDAEGEIQVSFREVAASHPILRTWEATVEKLANQHGLVIQKG